MTEDLPDDDERGAADDDELLEGELTDLAGTERDPEDTEDLPDEAGTDTDLVPERPVLVLTDSRLTD